MCTNVLTPEKPQLEFTSCLRRSTELYKVKAARNEQNHDSFYSSGRRITAIHYQSGEKLFLLLSSQLYIVIEPIKPQGLLQFMPLR